MRPLPRRRLSDIRIAENADTAHERLVVGYSEYSIATDLRRTRRRMRKRLFDAMVIFVLAPVIVMALLGVALAVAVTSRDSILFAQDRLGLDGRIFRMRKFRTMVTNVAGGDVTLVEDVRVTPLGRVLRQTHLDELPQVWNVLKGEMSLVGPRPEQPSVARRYTQSSPEFALRLRVLPGITGWAQVCCSYAGDHRETMVKLAHDLYYIEHQSLAFDVRILARTAVVMARRCGR
jgi:lipopolysaccharide/colanic/teichoic acid biosynthesis glycosyltransferase